MNFLIEKSAFIPTSLELLINGWKARPDGIVIGAKEVYWIAAESLRYRKHIYLFCHSRYRLVLFLGLVLNLLQQFHCSLCNLLHPETIPVEGLKIN